MQFLLHATLSFCSTAKRGAIKLVVFIAQGVAPGYYISPFQGFFVRQYLKCNHHFSNIY